MSGPIECKWCGCEEVATKTDSEIVFRCWSSYVVEDDYWTVSNNCGARCAVQLAELRERVQRAAEVLEGAERHEMVIDQNGDIDWVEIPEGTVMLSAPANEAIAILKGETGGKAD